MPKTVPVFEVHCAIVSTMIMPGVFFFQTLQVPQESPHVNDAGFNCFQCTVLF